MFHYPVNNKKLFCFPIILVGLLDLATTVTGLTFFGATEVNPLLSSLTQARMPLLIGLKITATLLTALIFYKGASIAAASTNPSSPNIRFLKIAHFTSLTLLALIVTNNIITLSQLA
jgi:hypothetical protein